MSLLRGVVLAGRADAVAAVGVRQARVSEETAARDPATLSGEAPRGEPSEAVSGGGGGGEKRVV
jgi:hypothetical protein